MLNIDDATKLLSLPKATIRRWIRQGKIPVHEARGEYFFDKKNLEKWARKHNIFLRTNYEKPQSHPSHPEGNLLESMKRGGVFFHVKGETVAEVLKQTVYLTPLPPEVDKEFLVDLLLQREKLGSPESAPALPFRIPVIHWKNYSPVRSLPPAFLKNLWILKPLTASRFLCCL
jgi:PTS system nitrogen regulatory IIA component